MDYKVADLRKKLNKLKYSTGTKTDRIARLMKDYEKVVNMNAEIVSFLRADTGELQLPGNPSAPTWKSFSHYRKSFSC